MEHHSARGEGGSAHTSQSNRPLEVTTVWAPVFAFVADVGNSRFWVALDGGGSVDWST